MNRKRFYFDTLREVAEFTAEFLDVRWTAGVETGKLPVDMEMHRRNGQYVVELITENGE